MPREAFALLIVANIMNERQDQFPFNLSSFFTGKVPRSDQKMGRMRFYSSRAWGKEKYPGPRRGLEMHAKLLCKHTR